MLSQEPFTHPFVLERLDPSTGEGLQTLHSSGYQEMTVGHGSECVMVLENAPNAPECAVIDARPDHLVLFFSEGAVRLAGEAGSLSPGTHRVEAGQPFYLGHVMLRAWPFPEDGLWIVTRHKDHVESRAWAKNELILGLLDEREPVADIAIPDPTISRRHVHFISKEARCVIKDMWSNNGTYVNGRRVRGPQAVMPHDKFYIGRVFARAMSWPRPLGQIYLGSESAGHRSALGAPPRLHLWVTRFVPETEKPVWMGQRWEHASSLSVGWTEEADVTLRVMGLRSLEVVAIDSGCQFTSLEPHETGAPENAADWLSGASCVRFANGVCVHAVNHHAPLAPESSRRLDVAVVERALHDLPEHLRAHGPSLELADALYREGLRRGTPQLCLKALACAPSDPAIWTRVVLLLETLPVSVLESVVDAAGELFEMNWGDTVRKAPLHWTWKVADVHGELARSLAHS